ncbi:unnamed protein product [Caenorhabditis angaria]|uniref:Uncharacterized protein n=1 Tax=Caenorhabditis angaria TaxID=860376 RepID=A0A9P1IUZ6_9PELO|nr:unnamed protein product [Caenorhabditis angaria]
MSNTSTVSTREPYSHDCEGDNHDYSFYVWLVALVICFLAFLSLIYVVFRYYKIHTLVLEFENGLMEMLDEALQILLPLGICKMISLPNTAAINPLGRQLSQDVKTRQRENRYPEDVTWPHSNIEHLYDMFGDDETRMQRTLNLSISMPPVAPTDPLITAHSVEVCKTQDEKEKDKTPKKLNISNNRVGYSPRLPSAESKKPLLSDKTRSEKTAIEHKKPAFSMEIAQGSKDKIPEKPLF